MNIFAFISGIFSPAAKLVDDLHTSEEEKLALRNELANIEAGVTSKAIELEKAQAEAKASVMVAEATSDGFITRSWRPIIMLGLFGLVILDHFRIGTVGQMNPELFEIFKYGVIGIGGGRSAEKIAKIVKGKV
jgi:hypothetical protein